MRKNRTGRKIRLIAESAMLAALCFLGTFFIRIPVGIGHVNLGDAFVIFTGVWLGPLWGPIVAGVGSAIADVISYPDYTVATFLIKALMALLVSLARTGGEVSVPEGVRLLPGDRFPRFSVWRLILFSALAEIVMIVGYWLFYAVFYAKNLWSAFLLKVPANGTQAVFGMIIGLVLVFAVNNLRHHSARREDKTHE